MKPTLWAEVHRLRKIERLSISHIASQLKCSRYLVRRALQIEQPPAPESASRRQRLIEPFKEQIERILEKHPKLSAIRILEKIAKPNGQLAGYRGGITQLRIYLKAVRPKPTRVYHEVHYDPGEALQVDWGDVGTIHIGKAKRRVSVFVAVLCHSRMIYIHFTLSQRKNEFYRSIVQALNFFGGSSDAQPPKVIGGRGTVRRAG